MPNYNDAQGVADLLSQFDFNIINEGPGDFSTQHRKYTCEFSKPGIESFTTTYQSNPDVHGQPTATDVFAALASDALEVDGLSVDTFADELGFEKPSQAIRAYESCHKTLDWLKNDMQLTTSEISDIAETLDNELDEVKEEVERVRGSMDFNDATALMRLVQAVENDPYVSSGAGEALADKVREFIEDEAELGGWYTELMNAIGEGELTFRECGIFTDHGFGFHAQDGTRTDYVIGWPFEDGSWAVLTGSYDLENNDLDCYLPEDYLNGLLSRYGYSSLADFKSVNGEAWRAALTGIIAGNQEANRFEVPHLFPDPSAAERFCTYQGVPGDLLRPAMEKARAEYEKVKAHHSPEKAVSLKGEVETARGASAAMADNGNHSNRGQDAR